MHACCIWYDFVSYSQLVNLDRVFLSVVYDTILSAIHNLSTSIEYFFPVVYDTILSAIHNILSHFVRAFAVVYDTILSAIHNCNLRGILKNMLYMIRFYLLFTTEMQDLMALRSLNMIWYFSYFKERRCKDTIILRNHQTNRFFIRILIENLMLIYKILIHTLNI